MSTGYALTDTDRRLANVVTIGTIKAVDTANGLAQVDLDGPESGWLPWMTTRAGGDRTWWAPEVGEQVVVAAPSGELGNGVILGCLYQDAHPEPADNDDVHRTIYADGTVVEYDRASHTLTVDTSASSGHVVIKATTVLVDCPNSTFTGNVLVQGRLTYQNGLTGSTTSGTAATIAGDINITGTTLTHNSKNIGSTHTHSGVQPGASNTGAPT